MEEEITLLTKDQVENLKVFKKYGAKSKVTDLCLWIYDFAYDYYWTKTPFSDNAGGVFYVDGDNGYVGWSGASWTGAAVRPVIPLSKIYQSKEDFNISESNGIEEIKYGEYPQSLVDEDLDKILENLYQQNKLLKTDKRYTLFKKGDKYKYQEFFYNGDKYVRMDGIKKLEGEKTYWIKVESIKWLVNKSIFKKDDNIAISKKLLTIMPFSYDNNNNYEKSDIKEFLEKYFVKEMIPSRITISYEEEKRIKQRQLLEERLERSQKVHDDSIKREEEAREEAQRIEEEKIRKEEERQQEIKDIEGGLINNFKDLNEKYNRLLELDSTKEIKYPHIYIEKAVLCDYDTESKSYKIKDKFIPYLSYIQFPYDMKDIDVRGRDLSNSIVSIDDVYNKSLEGCNLSGNKYVLNEVNSFDGYNLCDASVYSDTVLFLRGAYINSKTIESINKKYISEALEGAIIDKDSIEFLNNHREEYGINKSINVKVVDGENIESRVLFEEYGCYEDNNKYDEVIEEFKRKGLTGEDVMNIAKLMIEREKNNFNHM